MRTRAEPDENIKFQYARVPCSSHDDEYMAFVIWKSDLQTKESERTFTRSFIVFNYAD
jgi:hypothetical protein